MENLLTVKDVAKKLNIKPRTVYDNAQKLGGFYPFGINVLRFRPEVINGGMEGQNAQGLALRIPVSGGAVRRGRPRKQTGGNVSQGRTPERNQGIIKTDPSRHGL